MYQNLSSFYKDYIYEKEIIEDVFDAYINGINIPMDYAYRVDNLMRLSGAEIFRMFDSFKISSSEGVYDIEDISRNPSTVSYFPAHLVTGEEKMFFFISLQTHEKINILKQAGFYIKLSVAGHGESREPRIIGFEAYTKSNRRLTYASEYIVEDNCLYLFGEASKKTQDNYELVLRNILIDINSVEDRLGAFLSMPYNPILSKAEYRDINNTFIEAAVGGPRLKNIRAAMQAMFGEEFTVYDAYSKNNEKKEYWESGALTPFDFIVNIPLEYSVNQDKLNLFYDYLSIIKPPESSFFVNWGLTIGDIDSAKITDLVSMAITPDLKIDKIDNIKDSVIFNPTLGEPKIERISLSSVDRFDMSKFSLFDSGLVFDRPVTSTLKGKNEILEICSLNHIVYPEMPINKIITKSEGRVNIRFTHSNVLNLNYKIYKDEVLVKTIDSSAIDEGAAVDYFEDLNPGTYVYSIRSAGYPSVTDPSLEKLSVPAVFSPIVIS